MRTEDLFPFVDGLLERLSGVDYTHFELSWGEIKFRIEREGNRTVVATPVETNGAPQAVTVSSAPVQTESVGEAAPAAKKAAHVVTSPIVGTFYAASSPDAMPFVLPGQSVAKGDTLCIIEAMKMMNEIESEIDGVIAKVHAANGQLVEFGQLLFEMEDA